MWKAARATTICGKAHAPAQWVFKYTPRKLMSFSKNAAFASRSLLTASPSHSGAEKRPSAKPSAAHAPGAPFPAPLTTPATMSWMKRKGGFASSFSVSFGFASSGCRSVGVSEGSPVAPSDAALLKALLMPPPLLLLLPPPPPPPPPLLLRAAACARPAAASACGKGEELGRQRRRSKAGGEVGGALEADQARR